MDKFVSYDKMSKKEKKKIDSSKRGNWNGVDPATKVVDSDKVYPAWSFWRAHVAPYPYLRI